jgi:hypothetical protein
MHAGHTIAVYGESDDLPAITAQATYAFAKAADLVVVDSTFPLERTRRSWKPSPASTFVEELRRKHDVVALGPTPTVDLLVGDRRYLRKWCERLGIPWQHDSDILGPAWTSGAWFKANDVVPPGPYLESWKPLFKSINFRGWFQLDGRMTPDGPVVNGASATWSPSAIPDAREAEFLRGMAA